MTATFSVTVDSPADLRDQFVEWLELMEKRELSDSKFPLIPSKKYKTACPVRATAYKRAAEFWREITINEKPAPTPST